MHPVARFRDLAVLALAVAISTAQAQEERAIIGPMDFSCGKWINTPKHTSEYFQLRYWVLGYLSGINMESGADFLRDRDADGLPMRAETKPSAMGPPYRGGAGGTVENACARNNAGDLTFSRWFEKSCDWRT